MLTMHLCNIVVYKNKLTMLYANDVYFRFYLFGLCTFGTHFSVQFVFQLFCTAFVFLYFVVFSSLG